MFYAILYLYVLTLCARTLRGRCWIRIGVVRYVFYVCYLVGFAVVTVMVMVFLVFFQISEGEKGNYGGL